MKIVCVEWMETESGVKMENFHRQVVRLGRKEVSRPISEMTWPTRAYLLLMLLG